MTDGVRRIGLVVAMGLAWWYVARVGSVGLPLPVLVGGAVQGLLVALGAVGLVLVHRSDATVNLGQAELGMVGAVLATGLAGVHGIPWLAAVVLGTVVGGGSGLAVRAVVLPRLLRGPTLTATVATLGIGQVLAGLALLAGAGLGLEDVTAPVGLGSDATLVWGPLVLTADHALAVVAAGGLLGGVALALHRSRAGLQLRAIDSNRRRAALDGIPVERVAAGAWAIAGAASALAAILRAPLLGAAHGSALVGGGPAFLLRAITAAVLGGMRSPARATAAAVAIGMLDAGAGWVTGRTAAADVILVLVLIATLLRRRDDFRRSAPRLESMAGTVGPAPAAMATDPLLRALRWAVPATAIALAVAAPVVLSSSQEQGAALIAVYAVLGVSLLVLGGWSGQLSFGHLAVAGVGGAVAGVLYGRHGLDLMVAAPIGMAASAAVCVALGLPTLRARGLAFTVTTLGFGVAGAQYLLTRRHAPWLVEPEVEVAALWGRLPLTADWQRYELCLAGLLLTIAAATALRRSAVGRSILATRDDDRAAAAAGIRVPIARLTAFAVSGAMAGFGGVLLVLQQQGFHTEEFAADAGLRLVAMVVVGGLHSITGAVTGAIYIGAAELLLPPAWRLLASGVGITVALLAMPEGIGALVFRARDAIARRRRGAGDGGDGPDASTERLRVPRRNLRRSFAGVSLRPLLVVLLAQLVIGNHTAVFAVVQPDLRADLGLSLTATGALLSVMTLGGFLASLPAAWLADRLHRPRLAAAGLMTWGVAATAVGLAPGVVALTALLLVAMIASRSYVVHRPLLADLYDPGRRSATFVAHDLVTVIAAALVPLGAGFLAEAGSWRTPFLGLVLTAIPAAVLLWRLDDPSRGRHERLAAGASPDAALVEEEPAGWREAFRTLGAFPSVRALYAAVPFLTATSAVSAAYGPEFLERSLGMGARERGIVLGCAAGAAAVGLLVGGARLQQHLTPRPSAAMRLLVRADVVSLVLLGLALLAPGPVVVTVALMASAFAVAIVVPGLYAVASLVIPPRMRAMGFASAAAWAVPGLFLVPLAGLVGDAHGPVWALAMGLPTELVAIVLLVVVGRRVDRDAVRAVAKARLRSEARAARDDGLIPLVVLDGAETGVGATTMLHPTDLRIADGEFVAVTGTNGAGKSTLLRMLAGELPVRDGAGVIDGVELTGADVAKLAGLGVQLVPAEDDLYDDLTVAECSRLLAPPAADRHRPEAADVTALVPELAERADVRCGELSGGERRLVSLGIALLRQPRLLLVDELTSGLSPVMSRRVVGLVRSVAERGTTVVAVEQSRSLAARAAPRVVVIEDGRITYDGDSRSVPEGRAIFVLSDRDQDHDQIRGGGHASDGPVLEGRALTRRIGGIVACADVDVAVRPGEVLAVVGPNGAGKTTVLDLLAGAQPLSSGQVLLHGSDVTGAPPWRRAELGIARCLQLGGLWRDLTLEEALAVRLAVQHPTVGPVATMLGFPDARTVERAIRDDVAGALARFNLEPWRHHRCRELSTGLRRIADLAGAWAVKPHVLLVDEPTAGLAKAEVAQLPEVLRQLVDETGCAMVVVDHDPAFVDAVADRAIGLVAGRAVACGSVDDVRRAPAIARTWGTRTRRRTRPLVAT